MRIKIAQYDLRQPHTIIWGLEGYEQVWVLARNGRQLLGVIRIGLHDGQGALSCLHIEQAISDQLGILPAEQAALAVSAASLPISRPPISVVVCTRDRALSLERCLAALKQLDYPVYEVIVVDNASRDDATARVVAATPFRYVREDRPGLDWARNRGAAEAHYDIIAYLDDDAQASPDWLHGVADAFADPQVSAVTGLVLPEELETRAQLLFEEYGGMSKGVRRRLFQRASMCPREIMAAHATGVGANMAFRRQVFETIGGFDTALDVGTPSYGGGDLDMFHRVLAAGLTLCYEPAAWVWHRHRREMSGLCQQLYSNGRGFGVYLIKIWRTGSIERRAVARFAFEWFTGWILARLIKGLLGRLHFPLTLLWLELLGALHAPWAYLATYRRDRRIRCSIRSDTRASFGLGPVSGEA